MTNPTQALERFVRPKTILLTSYRRNGTSVGTPVHIAVNREHAFVRMWDKTWKFRRIRNNPMVEIAPATWRGQPTGPASRAHARVLDGSEALHAAHALACKYPVLHGFLIPLVHRLRDYRTVHIELTPN
ncbi:PPOX class F420-dependent oxidoreductase [Ktedonobacter racemifer]|uniref:Putative F420-dependent enzyme n=1 Tax=Ktedonobacter racemifer DSM 44963 TaxID=485913 RepID=D6U8V5_KTERA|nr:PPOX class F420-dependent oxidoreductase [Ktedonobacter racemifer]EFH79563.1 putative F420-dependent enzyme [Ktedonobacter racemifer DSM 44963]